MKVKYRRAEIKDVDEILSVRNAVNENKLSDPSSVTPKMCEEYLYLLGRGWVCVLNGKILGFTFVAKKDNSIWALFVLPEFESKGIGRELLNIAINFLFKHGASQVVLETEAFTRADNFYFNQGWQRGKVNEKGDVPFVLKRIKKS